MQALESTFITCMTSYLCHFFQVLPTSSKEEGRMKSILDHLEMYYLTYMLYTLVQEIY